LNIEAELIVLLLRLTRSGTTSQELIKNDAKTPSSLLRKLLQRLQHQGLVYLRGSLVEANEFQRLGMAILAVQSGADLERVSTVLEWREFEAIAGVAFERNGYDVKRNLHFKHTGKRWEIDIVGCKRPFVVCVDCKHWSHGVGGSTLRRIVMNQVERTCALADSLPNPAVKIDLARWDDVTFVPAVLSLVACQSKFYDGVPVVSVLQLQDFLGQLPAYIHSLRHVSSSKPNSRL
jgi:Holliday junction resolvase-like predicted endonuclease